MQSNSYFHHLHVTGDGKGGIQGAAIYKTTEYREDDGTLITVKNSEAMTVALAEGDPGVPLAKVLGDVNVAALKAIDAQTAQIAQLQADLTTRTQERDTALVGKTQAEAQRDAVQAQLDALTAAPTTRFIKKWQFFTGLRMDGMTEQQINGVKAYIAAMPAAVLDLWDGSGGIEEGSPFVAAAATAFGWTDAQVASMWNRYPNITQADVAALLPH